MLQHTIPRCNTLQSYLYPLQHNATHYNTMQHAARHCNSISAHTATQCNTLQHTVTHCNTLQHTATVSLPIARARVAFCLRVRAFHRGAQNLGPLRNFSKVNTKPNLLPKSTIDLCFEKFRVGAWYCGTPHPPFWKFPKSQHATEFTIWHYYRGYFWKKSSISLKCTTSSSSEKCLKSPHATKFTIYKYYFLEIWCIASRCIISSTSGEFLNSQNATRFTVQIYYRRDLWEISCISLRT